MTSELLEGLLEELPEGLPDASVEANAGTVVKPVPERLLSVDGLHVSVGGRGGGRDSGRGGVEAVTDVSFTVGAGEVRAHKPACAAHVHGV